MKLSLNLNFIPFIKVTLNDPSQVYRPEPKYEEYNIFHNLKAEIPKDIGKEKEQFRTYDKENVTLWEVYQNMHTKQTVSLGKEMVKIIIVLHILVFWFWFQISYIASLP